MTTHGPHDRTCTSCQPPAPPPETGTLYLSPRADESADALRNLLDSLGLSFDLTTPGVFAVPIDPGVLARLADRVPAAMTEAGAASVRAAIVRPGALPTLSDFMNTQPLDKLLARVRHCWLADILRDERVLTHFHPIVSAAHPSRVFAYECLVRGVRADGTGLIPPGELFAAARASDMLFSLDRLARLTAIRSAEDYPHIDRLFVNFNPSSIYIPSACLRTTFRAVEQAGLDPGRVVFEVVESEEVRDTTHLVDILKVYREAGFGVALDDVGAGYSSLNLLTRLRPDFVKLDMALIRGVDRDPYKAHVVRNLLQMAADLGVRSVVEGVETVGEWEWAREHGADYVQGYLFARPATPPPRPTVPGTCPVAVG